MSWITCAAVWNILHTTQLKTLLTEFSLTFTLQVNIPLRPRSRIDFDGMIRAIRTTFKGDNCFTIRELSVFAIVSGLYKLSIK